jgi:energy-coupling factor transporter transmembrane protein EcfT
MSINDAYQTPKANLERRDENIDLEYILEIAKRQKALLYTFLIYILLSVLSEAVSADLRPIIQLLILPAALAVVIFTARLCWNLYGKLGAIIMIILSFVPLINLLVLLFANSKANSLIKSGGFKVGFMGANTSEIMKAI